MKPLPRWVRQVRVVLIKELVDSFRDKRALSSILLSIIVGPLITAFMMNRIADRQKEADDVRIPIVGARNAPRLGQRVIRHHVDQQSRHGFADQMRGRSDRNDAAAIDQDDAIAEMLRFLHVMSAQEQRRAACGARNLDRIASGLEPLYRVDRPQGA